MSPTLFFDLAKLCEALEATTKRKEKTRLLAEFLRRLDHEEVASAVLLIVGSIFPEFDQRTLEVGGRTMRRVLKGGRQTILIDEPLTIQRVHRTLEEIAEAMGPGSRRLKEGLLEGLISRAGPKEVEVLVRIVFGEMRIGVSEGMMLGGIAEAAGSDLGLVRRALMLTGDLGEVARIALERGEEALKRVGVRMFVPLKPMLASMAYDIAEVIEEHGGRAAFEYKLKHGKRRITRCLRLSSPGISSVPVKATLGGAGALLNDSFLGEGPPMVYI